MKEFLNYSKYEIEDFVEDSRFIRWITSPTVEEDLFWEQVATNYPGHQKKMDEAREYLYLLGCDETRELKFRKDDVLGEVFGRFSKKKSVRRFYHDVFKYAAILVLFIGGAGYYMYMNSNTDDYDYSLNVSGVNATKVILSDGMEQDVKKNDVKVVQRGAGALVVNNDTLKSSLKSQENGEQRLNHIIVPYGTQSEIELSDGTMVILNAGSKLSFPDHFLKDKREVYLIGEAFFEVSSDKKHPFVVHTSDMDVVATGTKFNINCYPDNQELHAALVEGTVHVSGKGLIARNYTLRPGEAAFFDRVTEEISVKEVKEELYVSWIHGYLICEKEPISILFGKLGRYYNQTIICNQNIEGYCFSGKLDLRDDLDEVLNIISIATQVKVSGKE